MGDAFSAPFILSCYKIIVPHTQLAIKWFTQMTKTLKTLFFFICYHPSPRQPAGKVQSFGPEGWGYSEGGQIKTNFSLFSFVCVGVCAKYFWPRETISPVVFLWKSVGIPVFLLMQYKSGSLYFLHKLLNETAYLRSIDDKSQRWGIDRQVRDRWYWKEPFRGQSCTLCKGLQGFTQVMTYLKWFLWVHCW